MKRLLSSHINYAPAFDYLIDLIYGLHQQIAKQAVIAPNLSTTHSKYGRESLIAVIEDRNKIFEKQQQAWSERYDKLEAKITDQALSLKEAREQLDNNCQATELQNQKIQACSERNDKLETELSNQVLSLNEALNQSVSNHRAISVQNQNLESLTNQLRELEGESTKATQPTGSLSHETTDSNDPVAIILSGDLQQNFDELKGVVYDLAEKVEVMEYNMEGGTEQVREKIEAAHSNIIMSALHGKDFKETFESVSLNESTDGPASGLLSEHMQNQIKNTQGSLMNHPIMDSNQNSVTDKVTEVWDVKSRSSCSTSQDGTRDEIKKESDGNSHSASFFNTTCAKEEDCDLESMSDFATIQKGAMEPELEARAENLRMTSAKFEYMDGSDARLLDSFATSNNGAKLDAKYENDVKSRSGSVNTRNSLKLGLYSECKESSDSSRRRTNSIRTDVGFIQDFPEEFKDESQITDCSINRKLEHDQEILIELDRTATEVWEAKSRSSSKTSHNSARYTVMKESDRTLSINNCAKDEVVQDCDIKSMSDSSNTKKGAMEPELDAIAANSHTASSNSQDMEGINAQSLAAFPQGDKLKDMDKNDVKSRSGSVNSKNPLKLDRYSERNNFNDSLRSSTDSSTGIKFIKDFEEKSNKESEIHGTIDGRIERDDKNLTDLDTKSPNSGFKKSMMHASGKEFSSCGITDSDQKLKGMRRTVSLGCTTKRPSQRRIRSSIRLPHDQTWSQRYNRLEDRLAEIERAFKDMEEWKTTFSFAIEKPNSFNTFSKSNTDKNANTFYKKLANQDVYDSATCTGNQDLETGVMEHDVTEFKLRLEYLEQKVDAALGNTDEVVQDLHSGEEYISMDADSVETSVANLSVEERSERLKALEEMIGTQKATIMTFDQNVESLDKKKADKNEMRKLEERLIVTDKALEARITNHHEMMKELELNFAERQSRSDEKLAELIRMVDEAKNIQQSNREEIANSSTKADKAMYHVESLKGALDRLGADNPAIACQMEFAEMQTKMKENYATLEKRIELTVIHGSQTSDSLSSLKIEVMRKLDELQTKKADRSEVGKSFIEIQSVVSEMEKLAYRCNNQNEELSSALNSVNHNLKSELTLSKDSSSHETRKLQEAINKCAKESEHREEDLAQRLGGLALIIEGIENAIERLPEIQEALSAMEARYRENEKDLAEIGSALQQMASMLSDRPEKSEIDRMLRAVEDSLSKRVANNKALEEMLKNLRAGIKERITKGELSLHVNSILEQRKEKLRKDKTMIGKVHCLSCDQLVPGGVNMLTPWLVNNAVYPRSVLKSKRGHRTISLPVLPGTNHGSAQNQGYQHTHTINIINNTQSVRGRTVVTAGGPPRPITIRPRNTRRSPPVYISRR